MKKQDLIKLWLISWLNNLQIDKIITKITDLSNNQLFLIDEINDDYFEKITDLFARFKGWEPFEYLINNSEFYGLDFYVDNRVLIPRNDTEVLVSEAIKEVENTKQDFVLIDVWTWSWCIPISIIKNSKNNFLKQTYALDISLKALKVAKINIEKYSLKNKIIESRSDLLNIFTTDNVINPQKIEYKKVVITANLPYIKYLDFTNMDYSVIYFEPELALYWGKETWFELYEKLLVQCFEIKKLYKIEQIILFIEIWFDQEEYSKKYLENKWLKFEFFKDNSGVFRCVRVEV